MKIKFKSSVFFCRMLPALVVVLFGCLPVKAQCSPEQIYKLLPDDGAADDSFAIDVAISGTTAIVGAWRDDDNGADSGSAYLFDVTTGQQIAKLLPDDGATGDQFGGPEVGISGTTAIVGAYHDDDNGTDSGSAYLFDTTTGNQIAKLLPDDGAAGDLFGYAVEISGNTAIVGARLDDDNGESSGSAYLFDTTTGQQIAKLLPDDGAEGDEFGLHVSISGMTAIVSTTSDDDNGAGSGSAYLFDVTTGQQIAKLLPNDGAEGDSFGRNVGISATTAIVGAYHDDDNGTDSGSAYLFDTTTGNQIAKLLPDDGATDDHFGRSVGISGSIAIVGAIAEHGGNIDGDVYLFDTTTGQQIAKLHADDGWLEDRFGNTVAISGLTAIVGAVWDDDNGNQSGSAYVFDLSSCTDTDIVVPNSFLVTRGTHVSGGVVDLAESDNADFSLRRATSDIQSRTEYEVKAVCPVASPASVEVTLEGSVFARSNVDQSIELFDYVAAVWEQVDTRAATRFTDTTVTVAATGDLSRFVEAGTMCIKARIRYQSTNPRQRFASNTDQFVWTIGQ